MLLFNLSIIENFTEEIESGEIPLLTLFWLSSVLQVSGFLPTYWPAGRF
jgi:hypothetical protein